MPGKKKKIAIFHCGFIYSGGGERVVLEEAWGLRKRGYEVLVLAPNVDDQVCFPELMSQVSPETFLPQLPRWFPFRDGLLMIATSVLAPVFFYRFRDVDLFFGANQPGAWLAFCLSRALRKPYLVYLNQPNRLVYPRLVDQECGWQNRSDYYLLAALTRVFKPLFAKLDKLSFTSGKAMLVDGHYIDRSVKQIYGRKTVLAPAAAHWQPISRLKLRPGSAFRGEFRINRKLIKKPYLLVTNRHEPQKKFEYVLQAFKEVLVKFPRVSLVITGSPTSYTRKLLALGKKLGIDQKVVYTGQVNEKQLGQLYQASAVYCYPSPDEDFGLGPIEAGGWGLPTVAWNCGGPTVTVVHGKTGYLAKPFEVEDYAKGIGQMLADPEKRVAMGRAAWQRTKEEFSWNNHLDILEAQIEKALSHVFPLRERNAIRAPGN